MVQAGAAGCCMGFRSQATQTGPHLPSSSQGWLAFGLRGPSGFRRQEQRRADGEKCLLEVFYVRTWGPGLIRRFPTKIHLSHPVLSPQASSLHRRPFTCSSHQHTHHNKDLAPSFGVVKGRSLLLSRPGSQRHCQPLAFSFPKLCVANFKTLVDKDRGILRFRQRS